jgi:hypothetical protein
MPESVYDVARTLAPSFITGTTRRESGNYPGRMIKQNTYLFARNKKNSDGTVTLGRLPAGLAPKLKPHHATDPYAGMVRFDNPSGGHSKYLTFRVMTEDSTGWIRPSQPGKFPLKQSVDAYRALADTAFKAALQKDVDALLGG